jgi:regulator of sigma E protease
MILITIIIPFLIVLTTLVIIHELGHYLTAKKFGIKVEEFGFGVP